MATSLPNYLGEEKCIERREQSGTLGSASHEFQETPATLEYAREGVRKSTFNKDTWPQELQHLVEPLAKAGFYSSGPDDSVKCYSCGIALKNLKSDSEPWKVHARLNKNCSFLRLTNGAEEVDKEWDSAKKEFARWFERKMMELDIQDVNQTLWDNNVEIRSLSHYVAELTDENARLKRENKNLAQKSNEKIRKLNDYIRSLSEETDKVEREIQELKEKVHENDETLSQMNGYATRLVENVESLQAENQELTQNQQKLIKRSDFERYVWKRAVRAKVRENRMLDDVRRRVLAEKDQLQAEKNNIARILARQSEEFQTKIDTLNGRIIHLEEQLEVKTVACSACMEFGYSREMVKEAVHEWERRHGYKAVDLMQILMEISGELQALGQGQERQHQREARQVDQLEGAVGGQVVPTGH